MNQGLAQKIDASNVKQGMKVWVKTRTLGSAYVLILEDRQIEGWRVEVLDGTLISPNNKQKRWGPGKTLTLPVASVDKFYELPEEPR